MTLYLESFYSQQFREPPQQAPKSHEASFKKIMVLSSVSAI